MTWARSPASVMNLDPAEYAAARPFPHTVLDGALPPLTCEFVRSEFPPPDDARWTVYDGEHESGKWQGDDPALWGRVTSDVLVRLQSGDFCTELERLTGIEGLVASTLGGGLHMTRKGGWLGMHTDFNRPPSGLYRAVNLLVFLDDLEGDWTAELDLTGPDGFAGSARGEVQCISPKVGRMVIFNTSASSWHGHPDPLRSEVRRSLAVYYYAPDPPPGYIADQGTVWFGEADLPRVEGAP